MSDHYVITGIPVPAGQPIPVRQSFTDWNRDDRNPIQVSLFVRALDVFTKMSYQDRLSFYQIAAIHGLPDRVWDNTPNPANPGGPDGKGSGFYCPHNQTIFPTWHRPYVLLFEQRIWEIMKGTIIPGLAGSFSNSDEEELWKAQADSWRLPYWDWARQLEYPANVNASNPPGYPGYGVPYMVMTDTWDIVQPGGGAKVTWDNPLRGYRGDGTQMGDDSRGDLAIPDLTSDLNQGIIGWGGCIGTSRYCPSVDTEEWQIGVNAARNANDAIVAAQFYSPARNVRVPEGILSDKVYRMFTDNYFPSWADFATTKHNDRRTSRDWKVYNSIEYIHNNIHGWTGGSDLPVGIGHMSDPAVAAFDPLFFLHHCNIDRQLAIWQRLNPSHWFDGLDLHSRVPDFDSNHPLVPFHGQNLRRSDGIFTSEDVKDITKLGYNYDILAPQGGTPDQEIQRIKNQLSTDYAHVLNAIVENGRQAKAIVSNAVSHTSAPTAPAGQVLAAIPAQMPMPSEPERPHHTENRARQDLRYHDFIIDVLYDRLGYHGGAAYTIHFFIGEITDAEIAAMKTPIQADHRQVGSIFTFTNATVASEEVICANCSEQAAKGVLSEAQIPLTLDLLRRALDDNIQEFNDLQPASVEQYLSQRLTWKAVNAAGQVIPHNDLPKTKVFVLAGEASHNVANSLHPVSTYGNYHLMPEVTRNKPWDGAANQAGS